MINERVYNYMHAHIYDKCISIGTCLFQIYQTSIVDEYCMEDIEGKLNITRRGMIFIALLAGCDLDEAGVEGVGPKTGISLLQEYNKLGIDPIDRYFQCLCNSLMYPHFLVRQWFSI